MLQYVPVVGQLLAKLASVYKLYRGWERLPCSARHFMMLVRMTEHTLTSMYRGAKQPSDDAATCIDIIHEKIEAGERLCKARLCTRTPQTSCYHTNGLQTNRGHVLRLLDLVAYHV